MPVHDWTRVDAGLFHAFHHRWIGGLCDLLNTRLLPPDHFALIQPWIVNTIPAGSAEDEVYAARANCVAVQRRYPNTLAVIAVIPPGCKARRAAFDTLVRRTCDLMARNVSLVMVDLFPPSAFDPEGIHGAIWDEVDASAYALPTGKPLTVAAYAAGDCLRAYVDAIAVGEVLPDIPLFLSPDRYVAVPLEATYQDTWATFPAPLKGLLEPPAK